MADWIWMPFGVVSGVSRGIGVLDGSGDRRRGRGSFGGKYGASHCNQWEYLCKGRRRGSSQITLGFLVFHNLQYKQQQRCAFNTRSHVL